MAECDVIYWYSKCAIANVDDYITRNITKSMKIYNE